MPNQAISFKALILLLILPLLPFGCATWNPNEAAETEQAAKEAVMEFKKHDPSMKSFFDKAYAYAIYPTVGKGAMGVGGAYGSGAVYHGGKMIGYTSLSQVTIGFQFGGQAYREIIFFKNEKAFNKFKSGSLEFAAQATAVAATAGAAANASYANDVAVFTLIKGGLMYEASIGGQSFSFEPLKK
jgi:lipid-binding SYLF domain-containing protein